MWDFIVATVAQPPRAGSEQGQVGTGQNTRGGCDCRGGDLSRPTSGLPCAALVGGTRSRPDAAADEDRLFDGASGQANDAKAAAGPTQHVWLFSVCVAASLCLRLRGWKMNKGMLQCWEVAGTTTSWKAEV